MKRICSSKVVIWGMGLSIASAAQGYVHNHEDHSLSKSSGAKFGHHVVRPSLTGDIGASKVGAANFGDKARVQVDRKTKAIRIVSDPAVARVAHLDRASLEKTCLGFVDAHQSYFGRVTPKQMELNADAVQINDELQLLKYRVYHKGILIEDANIDCRFKFGKLVQVLNMSFSEAKEVKGVPQKGLQNVITDKFAVDQTFNRGQVYRVAETDSGYELVLTDVFNVNKSGEPYDIQVETNTGEVFEVRPLHHHINGKVEAQIFPRWWQDELVDTPIGQATISTSTGDVITDLHGHFTADAESRPRLTGFKGPQVDVRATTGELVDIDAVLSEDIYAIQHVRETSGPEYEGKQTAQAMIFHHTNLIINRARQYIHTPWFDRPLRANANLSSVCNAHWDGTTINFYSAGSGCANTGLISDVVYHEWGHGLDANTGGIADGAFSEGFGDIMSMIFTHSNILGIGFRTDGSEVRDLEPDRIYPQHASGGVHSEGLIIGGTFWDLWKLLLEKHGKEVANDLIAKYAFNVIVAATRYTDAYEALKVIDDDDDNLANGTPNLCLINEAFAAHGLAGEESACLMGELDTSVDDAMGNGNGVIEPGEMINIDVTLLNSTDADQTAVTGTATIVAGAQGVTLSQGDLDFGDIARGESVSSATPAVIEVASSAVCGSKFDVAFDVASTQRQARFTSTYQVGRTLVGSPSTVIASDLPLPITDRNTTSTTLAVQGGDWTDISPVYEARLKFEITHTYRGDLSVQLVSPSGDVFEIYKGAGSDDDVSFDQDITAIIGGVAGLGEWTFQVYDRANSDQGTLDSVELTLTPAAYECE